MKKFSLIFVAVMLLSLASKAETGSRAIAYVPPEFVESEWTYIGVGYEYPGIFDYFSTEFPEFLTCDVYKSNTVAGDYWFTPDISVVDIEQYLAPHEFIVHAQNPDKVWTSPIWANHPFIFCSFHVVPEILGIQGNAKNYGKLENRVVTFPEKSYIIGTFPSETPYTNNMGTFKLEIPDESGITDVAKDESKAVYYNLQGIEVATPTHGVYIEKRGNMVKKVRF